MKEIVRNNIINKYNIIDTSKNEGPLCARDDAVKISGKGVAWIVTYRSKNRVGPLSQSSPEGGCSSLKDGIEVRDSGKHRFGAAKTW